MIIICIASIIIVSMNKYYSRKTYLVLQFAPNNAVLTIDNSDLALKSGSYSIEPGHYSGNIQADHFKTKRIDFDVEPYKTNIITEYLTHETEGLKHFEKNASDMATLHQIKNDNLITNFINEYDHKASIYDMLPQEISWNGSIEDHDSENIYILRIKNGNNNPNCQGTLCLQTSGIKQNYDYLKDYLTQNGYNINDYEVFYEYSRL